MYKHKFKMIVIKEVCGTLVAHWSADRTDKAVSSNPIVRTFLPSFCSMRLLCVPRSSTRRIQMI